MSLPLTRRQFSLASMATLGLSLGHLSGCKEKKLNAFRVGLLTPKTGPDSQVGLACERGAKLAEELLKEICPSLEIIYADTESSVDIGRTKAEKLISEGVHLLIGAHNSGVTAAIAQVCEQRQVPFIVNIAAAPKITEQGYKYVFRNFQTTDDLTRNGLTLMNDLFEETGVKPKTATLLCINDTYGQAMYKSVVSWLPELALPFKLTEVISYDPRTQDLSAEISKIKASQAELLIPITRLNDAMLMIRECVKQRYSPMGIISPGSPGMYEKQFYKIMGEYSEYCITNTAWYNPQSPLAQKALSIFKKKFANEQFDLNVAFTAEAVWIAADAFKRAGASNAQVLQRAIKETNIQERIVYGGPIAFDEKGQALNIGSVSLQNRGGSPKIILPKQLQQEQPVFPFPAWQIQ